MNLKSGCILWPDLYHGPGFQFSPLRQHLDCDVAIIGSGISGALAAYHLTREGIRTVMLDYRQVAQGSTPASTGLLQYEIDTPLVDLISKLGQKTATAAYRASVESLDAFEPLVDDLDDRCGLVPRPSLYLASDVKDIEALAAEYEARRSMQIDVSFLSKKALGETFGIERPAALWSSKAFEVDPYRLTLQLIRRSVDRGLQVFTDTKVMGSDSHTNGVTLHTADGASVRARKVVCATGYESMEFLPHDLCQLASTFAVASQPLLKFPGWPQRCLIWESARPYLYMRTTQDGRVIIGGEDVPLVDPKERDRLLPQKVQVLVDRFQHLMPRIQISPQYAWAGTFAQTRDGLPYIGCRPNFPNVYFALGYGGNGITFSLLAAQIITQLCLGHEDERTRLFGFDR